MCMYVYEEVIFFYNILFTGQQQYRYKVVISSFICYYFCFRKRPSTIKKRFFSVFVMTFISPVPLYFGINENVFQKVVLFTNANNSVLRNYQ